jgi:hypothetical protein
MEEGGVVRASRRSRGTGGAGNTEGAVNGASTVVMRTPGKLATSPQGSGAQTKAPLAKTGGARVPGVQKQTGRGPVPLKTGKS